MNGYCFQIWIKLQGDSNLTQYGNYVRDAGMNDNPIIAKKIGA
jgi:hypothetical protein